MQILTDYSLKNHNAFGIDARAAYFVELQSKEQLPALRQLYEKHKGSVCILSGGSNVLFTSDYPGLVVVIDLKGKEVVSSTHTHVVVKAMAGENWDEFVSWCVEHDWGGLENLTMIPGCVGTSPMQNIGAYGVEIKDTFVELEALEVDSGEIIRFNNEQCRFGYRDSFFKQEGKGRYIILSVSFRLTCHNHTLRLEYGAIKQQLGKMDQPTLKDVMSIIRDIRSSKLPDPAQLGNAGSFFKNPVVSTEQFSELQSEYPAIPHFADASGGIKIPAAWLIESCGWKGYREGDAGVHKQQALVLVNYGKATGPQILKLASAIQQSVYDTFGLKLEREVNIIGPQTGI